MSDTSPTGMLLAEFEGPEAMIEALAALRSSGYGDLETFSPYEHPDQERILGLPRSRIPILVFLAGLLGAVLAYAIQWYTNAWDYPINVGGRPPHSAPAFIVITYETTILLAGGAAFTAFLFLTRLPRLWDPVFEVAEFERASVDRFWIGVRTADSEPERDRARRTLERLGAIRLVEVEP